MIARRLAALMTVLGFAAAAVLLLLSDRAGASLGDVLTFIARVGRRVERDSGLDLIDRADIPGRSDHIVHALFWGSGMLLIGWVSRRRVPIIVTGLVVGGVSLAFELAQPALSTYRAFETSDAVANLVGIGSATVMLLILVSVVRRIFGDDRTYSSDHVAHRDDITDELFLPLN